MQETQETWVRSLGREDPLEKGVAAHSSIPAWRISWAEQPGGLQSVGVTKSWPRLGTHTVKPVKWGNNNRRVMYIIYIYIIHT